MPEIEQNKIGSMNMAIFIAVAFLYWISLYLYVPTLPTYVQSKTDNLALVGLVLSMYGLWQAVIRLPLGILVDWSGKRKPFIIGGLLLAGLGAWFINVADTPFELILGRSITGLAAAAWVPMVVAFNRLFPANETVKATSIITFVNSGGRVLGSSSTGILNNWGGYSLPFLLAAGVAGLAVLFMLPIEDEPRFRVTPTLGGIVRLIARKDVLLPSLLSAVSQYALWTTTFGFNPILAKQLGATDVDQSLLVTINLILMILGNLTVTLLVNQIGARQWIYFSFTMLAIGVGLTSVAVTLPTLFTAQFFIGLSHGISFPALMGLSIRYVADSERNTAMGLHQSVYAIGMFGGPWLSGLLAQVIGLRWMLAVTTLGILTLGLQGTSKLKGES